MGRMAKKLDQIDENILRTLRDNARTPIVTLAKAIGLSRSATQERLARLEKSGTIAGYTIRFRELEESEIRVWMFLNFNRSILLKPCGWVIQPHFLPVFSRSTATTICWWC